MFTLSSKTTSLNILYFLGHFHIQSSPLEWHLSIREQSVSYTNLYQKAKVKGQKCDAIWLLMSWNKISCSPRCCLSCQNSSIMNKAYVIQDLVSFDSGQGILCHCHNQHLLLCLVVHTNATQQVPRWAPGSQICTHAKCV